MINKITPIILFLLSLCISASSQNLITGTKILNKSENKILSTLLNNYEIYEIDIQKKQFELSPTSTDITLKLGEASYEMNLFENNLNVKTKNKTNLPMLMGGSLRNGGTVSLTFNDDFIYGFIKSNGQYLFVEPLSYLDPTAAEGLYIVYDIHAVKEDREHVCGVTEVAKKTEQLAPMRTITTCKIIEIAIANTYDMVTKYTNATGAENHNLGVLNNVQTNYRSEFDSNIEFEVVAHFFPTSSNQDPLSPQTSTTDASVLLGNFRSWARGPGNAGGGNTGGATGEFGVDYNMASLWTDRDISFGGSNGTVGLAYTPGWHHLLEDYTGTAASLMSMVTHEKGHNFSANHDASGTNFIMAPSVTLTEVWSPASKTSINNRIGSQTYLDNCSTLGAPTAGMNQTALALCVGSSVEFEEQSQYGATRDWEFTNGTPATSTDEKETVTFNTAGLHAVKVTSYNASGSDIAFGYVDVQAAPPTACTPSGTGAEAITNVSISNMNNSSTGSAIYQDFACTSVATVLPNTSYSLIVGVAAGTTRIRYFVDYNDDGDFTDTNESSIMFTFSGSGNLGLTLNTPASMTSGQLLRLRIITSSASIGSDGCTSPTSGQVEDYSFYVEETQVFGCTDPNASNFNSAATVDDGSCGSGGTSVTWFRDLDNDNFGDLLNPLVAITQPAGYVSDNTDCDDNNANINPNATEICDGLDNDCNGQTDEGVTNTYYADSDGDGFGGTTSTQACSAPSGFVSNNNDCNDNNASINPAAAEICDGIDNNCNNQTDEGVTNTYYADSDGDGFGGNVSTQACSPPNGFVTNNNDCDDNNASINPSATEVCDGIDNNCNNQTDEGVTITYYADSDGDGFGGNVSTQACSPPNGFVTNNNDCNDNNASINPSATEVCDGIDNNCNNQTDEGVTNTYFLDSDGDGFGGNTSLQACTAPNGYVSNNSDCNDNNASINPSATEVCNDNIDNNCNNQTDEGCTLEPCDGTALVINAITQNTFRASVSIESTATVTSSSDILFTAGQTFNLEPGFEIVIGTNFEAKIEPCATTTLINNPNPSFNYDLGDLNTRINNFFDKEIRFRATIFNGENQIIKTQHILPTQLLDFVNNAPIDFEQGMYQLLLEQDGKEIKQEMFIIK